jgi:hypothetical protein
VLAGKKLFFGEKGTKRQSIENARQILVLPAAVAASWCVDRILGLLALVLVEKPLGMNASALDYVTGLFTVLIGLFVFYVPKSAVFVVAGAFTAPSRRVVTALVLAGVAIIASSVVHLLRPSVGLTNYTHFVAESVGAALGAGIVCIANCSPGSVTAIR